MRYGQSGVHGEFRLPMFFCAKIQMQKQEGAVMLLSCPAKKVTKECGIGEALEHLTGQNFYLVAI